jgi:hypothetical protein
MIGPSVLKGRPTGDIYLQFLHEELCDLFEDVYTRYALDRPIFDAATGV